MPTQELFRRAETLTAQECDPLGLFREMLALSPKKQPRILVVTSASAAFAEETGREHALVFKKLGQENLQVIDSRQPEVLRSPATAAAIREADIVYFTGGDQSDLTRLFTGTPAYETLRRRYAHDPGFVLAGSSAGAMVMARDMIDGTAPEKGACPPTAPGFAMIPAIIETHMNDLKRESRERRMLQALRKHPGNLAIGLDNASAITIHKGQARTSGAGRVLLAYSPECATPLPPDSVIELGQLRDCQDFTESGLRAHCYAKGGTIDLGNFSAMPNIYIKPMADAPEKSEITR